MGGLELAVAYEEALNLNALWPTVIGFRRKYKCQALQNVQTLHSYEPNHQIYMDRITFGVGEGLYSMCAF